jgi:hypothetical protein
MMSILFPDRDRSAFAKITKALRKNPSTMRKNTPFIQLLSCFSLEFLEQK